MRATDGLQATITLGSVKPHGQAFALERAGDLLAHATAGRASPRPD